MENNEEFNYEEEWDEQAKKELEKEIETFSRGYPRTGLKGKYLKRKGKLPGQRWPSKKKKAATLTEEESQEKERLKGLLRRY